LSEQNLISARFESLQARGRRALVPYITSGYPAPESTAALLDALADAGADIIELGVPFSDPVADGPTIQRSSFAALGNGVTVGGVLEVVRDFRAHRDVPVVLFSYLNPVLGYGVDDFIDHAVDAGASGVLLTDLPTGADEEIEEAFLKSPLALIRLIAPTTPPDRVRDIAASAQGFIYYVGSMGVTGARAELRAETLREVAALRAVATVPVAVGFGISTPAQAAEVAAVADGVIVGSALIDALDSGGIDAAAALLRDMRAAMDPQPSIAAG
jgi:tryptophan synthase alpha chain